MNGTALLRMVARSTLRRVPDLSEEVTQMLERMERSDLARQLDGLACERSTGIRTYSIANGVRSYSIEMDATSSTVVLDIAADGRVLAMHVLKPTD